MTESLKSRNSLPKIAPSEEAYICGYPVNSKEADDYCKHLLMAVVSGNPDTIWLRERYEARKALEFPL